MARMSTKTKKENKIIIALLSIITFITLFLFYRINILPESYFFIIFIILIIINILIFRWLYKKGSKRKVAFSLSIILIIGMALGITYELSTLGFLHKLGKNNFKIITYELVVLNESSYKELNNLEDKYIGLLNTTEEEYNQAIKFLDKKIKYESKKDDNYNKLASKLLSKEIDGVLIEQSANKILKEENEIYASNIKTVYNFQIEIEIKDISKKVDVTKDSFNIYISGIDSYGSVSNVSRSDVNIIVSINPKTKHAMITSIPRDYYVELPNKNGYKDKLTHAGIYGVEESVGAIESLLNIDINYYIKVNFTSLIDIVDAIGGITIDSEYEFTTGIYDDYTEPYTFKIGRNNLNGKEALAFSRERKAFFSGDRVRNSNQQIIIKAMINKILSPVILAKYNTLLESLSESFRTNMTEEEITSFIKKEIENNKEWKINNYVLDGTDDYDFTYSYQGEKLYVMKPDEESVNHAINEINKVINNE